MASHRRVQVDLSERLLKEAMALTGKNLAETLEEGLRLIQRTYPGASDHHSEWPVSVALLAGTWADLPLVEDLRQENPDLPRESF